MLGICSFLAFWVFPPLGVVAAITGGALSAVALTKCAKGQLRGYGMSVAGLVLNILTVAMGIVALASLLLLFWLFGRS